MAYPDKYYCTHALVYVLTDRHDNVFYVGCTTKPLQERLAGHLTDARNNYTFTNKTKNEKIRSLKYDIRIREIDRISVSASNGHYANKQGRRLEMMHIAKYYQMGCALVNGNREIEKALQSTEG